MMKGNEGIGIEVLDGGGAGISIINFWRFLSYQVKLLPISQLSVIFYRFQPPTGKGAIFS